MALIIDWINIFKLEYNYFTMLYLSFCCTITWISYKYTYIPSLCGLTFVEALWLQTVLALIFGGVFFISFLLIHSFMSFTKYWGKRQEWTIEEIGIAPWKEQDGEGGVGFQFSSVAQLCSTLCDPMNCSTPGLPVHHQLPEPTQTHVHWVGNAIQPSHPLSSPSPPALNLSQHQGLFKWVSSSHQVAKILEFQLQHQSFQWKLRTDFL